MAKVVVGLFDEQSQAREAIEVLIESGIDCDRISIIVGDTAGEYTSYPEAGKTAEATGPGPTAKGMMAGGALGGLGGVLLGLGTLMIPGVGPVLAAGPLIAGLLGAGTGVAAGGLIGSLAAVGISKEEAETYAEEVRRGETLVMVTARDDEVDRVSNVLDDYGAIDVEEHASRWHEEKREAGRGENVIPTMREESRMGKSPGERRCSRVYSYTMTGQEAGEVHVGEERASYEQYPVDRPWKATDIEAKERRKKIDIGYKAERESFREHCENLFAREGGRFADYESAYRYGYMVGSSGTDAGRDWNDVEHEFQSRWEQEHQNEGAWERVREAVHCGWQRGLERAIHNG